MQAIPTMGTAKGKTFLNVTVQTVAGARVTMTLEARGKICLTVTVQTVAVAKGTRTLEAKGTTTLEARVGEEIFKMTLEAKVGEEIFKMTLEARGRTSGQTLPASVAVAAEIFKMTSTAWQKVRCRRSVNVVVAMEWIFVATSLIREEWGTRFRNLVRPRASTECLQCRCTREQEAVETLQDSECRPVEADAEAVLLLIQVGAKAD